METLYTTNEAAGILKVHPNTVKNWYRQGKLGAVRIGERNLRFPESEIQKFAGLRS